MATTSFNDDFVIKNKKVAKQFKKDLEKENNKITEIKVFDISDELSKGEEKLKNRLSASH